MSLYTYVPMSGVGELHVNMYYKIVLFTSALNTTISLGMYVYDLVDLPTASLPTLTLYHL